MVRETQDRSDPVDAPAPAPAVAPVRIGDLARHGGLPLMAWGLAARIPSAMLPLGLLLSVRQTTGSYALAGTVVAATAIGGAAAGPAIGWWADRRGPRLPVLLVTAVQVLLIGTFAVLLPTASSTLLVAAAGLLGAANPLPGPFARWAWSQRLAGQASREQAAASAMAWESAADETSFVIGPVLASVLIAGFGAAPALTVAAALALFTAVGFAAVLPRPSAPAAPSAPDPVLTADPVADPLPRARSLLVPAILVTVAVGSCFGSIQAGIAARMTEAGAPGLAGPVYACAGLGSALAALASTRLPLRWGVGRRVALAGGVLVLASPLLATAHAAPVLALTCLGAGCGLAPALVGAYSAVEGRIPAHRLATVMVVLATCTAIGVSLGSGAAGALIDARGPGAALLLPLPAGMLVILAGLGLHRALRPRLRS